MRVNIQNTQETLETKIRHYDAKDYAPEFYEIEFGVSSILINPQTLLNLIKAIQEIKEIK